MDKYMVGSFLIVVLLYFNWYNNDYIKYPPEYYIQVQDCELQVYNDYVHRDLSEQLKADRLKGCTIKAYADYKNGRFEK